MLNAAKDFVFAVKALEEDATPEQCAAVLKGPLVGAGGADARIDFSTFVACVDGFSAAGAITSFNASDSGGKGFLDISDLAHMDMSDAEVITDYRAHFGDMGGSGISMFEHLPELFI